MTTLTRPFTSPLLVSCMAALTLALMMAGGSGAASLVAHASGSCSAPKYPGTGYFSSLTVTNTSCATGRQVTLAFYHCRLRHGAAGRCTSGVLGFSCSEVRQSIPTEVDARVTCRRHREVVVHTYQQDL
jgi:hypothetical protein